MRIQCMFPVTESGRNPYTCAATSFRSKWLDMGSACVSFLPQHAGGLCMRVHLRLV